MLDGDLQLTLGAFRLDTGPFRLPADGVSVVFGRSGSGKSTLLRAIAGFEPGVRGRLRFGDESWLDGARAMPPHRRGVGFVFQDAALLPHFSVRGNLLYAARRSGVGPESLRDIAERTGIAGWLDRSVERLSGGERQRVALARAWLSRPRLLCLDEPLAALDRRARQELLAVIEPLAQQAGIPVLYVTHSAAEVERLADRVLFVEAGRIVRIDGLQAALARPDSPLFEDEGAASVLEGRLQASGIDGLAAFESAGGLRLLLPQPADTPADPAMARRLRVLARDVSLAKAPVPDISVLNQLAAIIGSIDARPGGRVQVCLRLADGQRLASEITAHSAARLGLTIGDTVHALVKSVALIGA